MFNLYLYPYLYLYLYLRVYFSLFLSLTLYVCVRRDGVPAIILEEALDRAKEGRSEILKTMKGAQPSGPRIDVKETALKAMVSTVLYVIVVM